eukprot:2649492-Amphidinium_carterae.1
MQTRRSAIIAARIDGWDRAVSSGVARRTLRSPCALADQPKVDATLLRQQSNLHQEQVTWVSLEAPAVEAVCVGLIVCATVHPQV